MTGSLDPVDSVLAVLVAGSNTSEGELSLGRLPLLLGRLTVLVLPRT